MSTLHKSANQKKWGRFRTEYESESFDNYVENERFTVFYGFKGQCHEMDILFEGLNIVISTVRSVHALVVFNVIQKLSSTLYKY